MFIIIVLLMVQNTLSINIKNGKAFIMQETNTTWVEIESKQSINKNEILLSHKNCDLEIYDQDKIYYFNNDIYAYTDDLLINSKDQLLLKLTQLESKYLPPLKNKEKTKGLQYGSDFSTNTNIPYYVQRMNFVVSMVNQNNLYAALITLKRMKLIYPYVIKESQMMSIYFKLCELLGFKQMLKTELEEYKLYKDSEKN